MNELNFELRQVVNKAGQVVRVQIRFKEFLGPSVDDPYTQVWGWQAWQDLAIVTEMDLIQELLKEDR